MALHAMLLLAASIASTTALSMNRTINACQSSSTICDCQPTLCDDITVFTELEELCASHCSHNPVPRTRRRSARWWCSPPVPSKPTARHSHRDLQDKDMAGSIPPQLGDATKFPNLKVL